MSSGKSAITILAPMPDGQTAVIELTMQNFEMIAAAMKAAEERDNQ